MTLRAADDADAIARRLSELRAERAVSQPQQNPKRVAACDPEMKPPEAPALCTAVDGAGSSSEARTRQRAAAAPLPSGPVEVSRADPKAAIGGAGGSPAFSLKPVEHFPEDDWQRLRESVLVDRDRPRVVPARVLP